MSFHGGRPEYGSGRICGKGADRQAPHEIRGGGNGFSFWPGKAGATRNSCGEWEKRWIFLWRSFRRKRTAPVTSAAPTSAKSWRRVVWKMYAALLGYPFFVSGKIVHGRHKGHSFGYPTINQVPVPEKLLPPWGRLHLPDQGRGKALQQRDKHRKKSPRYGEKNWEQRPICLTAMKICTDWRPGWNCFPSSGRNGNSSRSRR